jgi:hypothetical protein
VSAGEADVTAPTAKTQQPNCLLQRAPVVAAGVSLRAPVAPSPAGHRLFGLLLRRPALRLRLRPPLCCGSSGSTRLSWRGSRSLLLLLLRPLPACAAPAASDGPRRSCCCWHAGERERERWPLPRRRLRPPPLSPLLLLVSVLLPSLLPGDLLRLRRLLPWWERCFLCSFLWCCLVAAWHNGGGDYATCVCAVSVCTRLAQALHSPATTTTQQQHSRTAHLGLLLVLALLLLARLFAAAVLVGLVPVVVVERGRRRGQRGLLQLQPPLIPVSHVRHARRSRRSSNRGSRIQLAG